MSISKHVKVLANCVIFLIVVIVIVIYCRYRLKLGIISSYQHLYVFSECHCFYSNI